MPIDFTTTLASSGSSYSENDDLDQRFGKANVDKWADLNNNRDEDEILARRQWARERAYRYINDRLRRGPYAVPFETPFPSTITSMEAGLAGTYLYESRGVTDYDADGKAQDQLQHVRKEVDRDIRDILTRRLRLSADLTYTEYPQVVVDDEEVDLAEERYG